MSTPSLFLSHSHQDRQVARRVARRLITHHVRVWLDERELRLGTALTASIRQHIQEANVLLVVASHASATSAWVGLEMDFAREHGKPIVPLFIDPLDTHERFRDHKGLDATSPQEFADKVHTLLGELHAALDLETPAADPGLLTAELRQVAKEEPALAPLIAGCLASEGLYPDNMGGVYGSSFHPLDEALNALLDLMPNERIALHAAYGFHKAGAGTRALASWIGKTGDGDSPLVTAVGEKLSSHLIPVAIKLLAQCDPANNRALYMFIDRNAVQLDQAQRQAVLGLVTWPIRRDTSRFAHVLGWVASRHFPEASELSRMWARWIHDGSFDGEPNSPEDLAGYLADAHKEELTGWEPVHEALRSHVRSFLRSGDRDKVVLAMDHVRAAADHSAPVLPLLLREAQGVSGTAEWKQWAEREPDAAEWSRWYVHEVSEQAVGERDWLRALKGTEQMVEFDKSRRRRLAEGPSDEP
jgi:hypothetical protein